MTQKWYSIKQVAEYLGVSEQTIRNRIADRQGVGSLFKKVAGEVWRANIDEIEEFLK